MVTSSIAAELLEQINQIKYSETVEALTPDHKLPESVFQVLKKSTIGRLTFSYDCFCNTRGTLKPAGMFKLFSKYSGKTPSETREDLISYVCDNKDKVLQVATNYFNAKHMDIGMWTVIMTRDRSPGDELALYLLCVIHNRHAVVLNKIKTWNTMDLNSIRPGTRVDLICDILLIYRLNGFCEATRTENESNTARLSDEVNVATTSSTSGKPNRKQRKTASIIELLNTANNKDQQVNKVSAQVSEENILPDGPRTRNTRDPTPL